MSLLKRFWITIAISLLCSTSCLSQDTTRVILPTEIVRTIFKDVKERDQLKYELHKKDSTIHVYESKEKLYQEEILSFKLSRDKYEKVITNLEEMARVREKEYQDTRRQLKNTRGGAAIIIAVLLTILLL